MAFRGQFSPFSTKSLRRRAAEGRHVCSPNRLQTELASGAEPRRLTVMRTIGYVRVSTDKQAEQGVSLEAQAEKIRAMALVHDAELLDIIVDGGESAKPLQYDPNAFPSVTTTVPTLPQTDFHGNSTKRPTSESLHRYLFARHLRLTLRVGDVVTYEAESIDCLGLRTATSPRQPRFPRQDTFVRAGRHSGRYAHSNGSLHKGIGLLPFVYAHQISHLAIPSIRLPKPHVRSLSP
jgi:Resolvase, N terminal domain